MAADHYRAAISLSPRNVELRVKLFNALVSTMEAHCQGLVGLCAGGAEPGETVFEGYCFAMSALEVAAWPPIEIVLGKDPETQVTVAVQPQAYLQQGWCDNAKDYQINISPNAISEGTMLGDTVMIGHTTVFDQARRRVGFVASPVC